MLEKIKQMGNGLLGGLFFVGTFIAIAFLLKGSVWISTIVLPWLFLITSFGVVIAFVILLPLSLISWSRKFGATALFIMSYLFGATLWFWGFLLTYAIWGWFGLIIGLVIAGVGVVPVALVASVLHGMWSTAVQLIILAILTFAFRAFGLYLLEKVEEKENAEARLLEVK